MCPGDDVILTCTVTASANKIDMLSLYLNNAFHEEEYLFHLAGDTINEDGSTIGPFTVKIISVGNDSIVATATIKGITSQNAACAGIICKDGFGKEKDLYVTLGKRRAVGTKVSELVLHVLVFNQMLQQLTLPVLQFMSLYQLCQQIHHCCPGMLLQLVILLVLLPLTPSQSQLLVHLWIQ